MTEIKKFTKVVLLVLTIIFLLMGTLLTFLFDLTMNPEGWTDPFYPRFFGGVVYVCAIFMFLMYRKEVWEEIKFTFEFLLGIFISTLTIQIVLWPIFAPFGAALTQLIISTTILMSIISLLAIISYIKQRD